MQSSEQIILIYISIFLYQIIKNRQQMQTVVNEILFLEFIDAINLELMKCFLINERWKAP